MREASTQELTEYINERLIGDRLKAEAYIEHWDGFNWKHITDLDEQTGLKWGDAIRKDTYATFPLTPTASNVSFKVINSNGDYSEGSEVDGKDGIFGLNTKIRLNAGYRIEDTTLLQEKTGNLIINQDWPQIRSQVSEVELGLYGPDVYRAPSDLHFQDIMTQYDQENYDDFNYSISSYAIFVDETIQITPGNSFNVFTSLSIFSLSDNIDIYVKPVYTASAWETETTTSEWEYLGNTIIGANTFNIPDGIKGQYLMIGVVLNNSTWTAPYDNAFASITYNYVQTYENIYQSVYYLDSPSFDDPPIGKSPSVRCSGRSSYKKALEQDVNFKEVDISGTALRDIIIEICDMVDLPYTQDSIAAMPSAEFPDRENYLGLTEVMKADKIFSDIMTILNKASTSKYVMYTKYDDTVEDNILYVDLVPTEYTADFVLNYHYYSSVGALKKNYDKMLKSIAVTNDKKPLGAETLLLSETIGVEEDDFEISPPAMVTRYVSSGDGGGAKNITKDSVTLTNTAGSSTIDVYGCRFLSKVSNEDFQGSGLDDLMHTGEQYSGGGAVEVSVWVTSTGTPDICAWDIKQEGSIIASDTGLSMSKSKQLLHENIYVRWGATTGHTNTNEWEFVCKEESPEFFAVSADDTNMSENKGITRVHEIKIVYDEAEALDIADGMIDAYSNPINETNNVQYPYLNLLLEQNDVAMMWTLNTFNDDLFFITKVDYKWDRAPRAGEGTRYSLNDTLLNFSDLGDGTYTYDNYYTDTREVILKYDIGYLYDMMFHKSLTNQEIDDATEMRYNSRC